MKKNSTLYALSGGLIFAIILSPIGSLIETSLVSHLVIEYPLLILSGGLIAQGFKPALKTLFKGINQGGFFGLLFASLIIVFWMIPRWLDASLANSSIAYAKYLSLFCAGLLLSISWPLAHTITRAIIKIEFLVMLFRLGWLYLISPQRLCNNYLLGEQVLLGQIFISIAFSLIIYWLIPIFFGGQSLPHSLSDEYQESP